MHSILAYIYIITDHLSFTLKYGVSRKGALYVLWMVSTTTPSAATTIIVCGTSDSIIVVADSRGTYPTGHLDNVCKIRRVNDTIFFAYAGDVLADTTAKIDSPTLVEAYLRIHNGTLLDRITYAVMKIRGLYRNRSILASKKAGDFFCKFYFFGIEGGNLKIYVRSLVKEKTNDKANISIRHHDYGNLAEYHHGNPLVSIFQNTIPSVQRFPDYLGNLPIISLATILMNFAFESDPKGTGGPIDMICLTRFGYQWIHKKPQCN